MQHPNKEQREVQAKFLAQLPNEQRQQHARLFRFGNASYIYHKESAVLHPTEADFEEWLIALPEDLQSYMKSKGFELCKGILSFTRYVMEKNDIGMDEWMKKHLSEDDYNEYCKLNEDVKNMD